MSTGKTNHTAKYQLRLDSQNCLQIIRSDKGVCFSELSSQLEQFQGLSEFERFRAERLLNKVAVEPLAPITSLNELGRQPMLELASDPGEAFQYRAALFNTPEKGAELILEYSTDASIESTDANTKNGGSVSAQGSDQETVPATTVEQLVIDFSSEEMLSLLKLFGRGMSSV